MASTPTFAPAKVALPETRFTLFPLTGLATVKIVEAAVAVPSYGRLPANITASGVTVKAVLLSLAFINEASPP